MIFGSDKQDGDMVVGDYIYGIYWKKTGVVHRSGLTREAALFWIEESADIFPGADIGSVWGIWRAEITAL